MELRRFEEEALIFQIPQKFFCTMSKDVPKSQRTTHSMSENPTITDADEQNDADYSDISDKDHEFSNAVDIDIRDKKIVQSSTASPPSVKSINKGVQYFRRSGKPRVNLSKLGTRSLRRYCKEYGTRGVKSDSGREQLLSAVQEHFVSQPPLDELEVIGEFTRRAKELKHRK